MLVLIKPILPYNTPSRAPAVSQIRTRPLCRFAPPPGARPFTVTGSPLLAFRPCGSRKRGLKAALRLERSTGCSGSLNGP